MAVESEIETGLRTAIIAQLVTDGITASIRSSLLDDEVAEDAEVVTYPYVLIQASPFIPMWMQSEFGDVSLVVAVATHAADDTKRTALLALYNSVRTVLDSVDLTSAVTSGSWKGLIVEEADPVTLDGNNQSITLYCKNKLCAVS
jgi:hypothetical protein